VWLKDVGMYLNTNLRCPDESVAQDGREFDFPLCKASKVVIVLQDSSAQWLCGENSLIKLVF